MSHRLNPLGQPIGEALADWKPASRPAQKTLQGRYCRLEALNPEAHAATLFDACAKDQDGTMWTYMPTGPFAIEEEMRSWMEEAAKSPDPLFYAIVNQWQNRCVGHASYLRIQPEVGVIEVGFIAYSPELQRTAAATETMYLMMRHAFDDLGYRRYEWKCDNLNAASQRAAGRLGFSYDGLFRQATIYKGRNRDTAWFSILDRDWPQVRNSFESWLSPENFGADGSQLKPLSDWMPKPA